jgi:hypothetical protein
VEDDVTAGGADDDQGDTVRLSSVERAREGEGDG